MSALVIVAGPPSAPSPQEETGFDFSDLRVFTEIPQHHYDVVAMRGIVVVYDKECLGREGIQMGKLYVREHQHPYSAMPWERWLERQWDERKGRAGPTDLLKTRREVVQAIHWPRNGSPALRMASGGVDGPYHEWAFGTDLIGKVVGVYRPNN